MAWNAGSVLYLSLAVAMVARSGQDSMRRRALRHDDGRWVILSAVVAAAFVVLFAIGSQLAAVKDLHGSARAGHAGLALLTLVTSWAFTQTMFALHYAHDFSVARHHGLPDPLSFPGTTDPGYADFLYFSCVIGTSGQTADVAFNGSALRATGLAHYVLAFFFNTTVLALTINIAAGLFCGRCMGIVPERLGMPPARS